MTSKFNAKVSKTAVSHSNWYNIQLQREHTLNINNIENCQSSGLYEKKNLTWTRRCNKEDKIRNLEL